jgi:hypothetical protein
MHLFCIELASPTGPHDLGGVADHGQPVKPLPEGVADEGSGPRDARKPPSGFLSTAPASG